LRASALAAFVVALVVLLAASWVVGRSRAMTRRFPVAAGLAFAAIMLPAVAWLKDGHPHDTFGPANQVTSLRAALVGFTAALVLEPVTEPLAWTAVGAAGVAALLDGVDGWLARRSGMSSAFGARFDLEIDALLIVVLAVLAWRFDKAGPWVLLSGLLRYLFIAGGAAFEAMRRPLPFSRRRQAICVLQILGLIVVLLPVVRPPASTLVAAAALAVLAYSFLGDKRWLWRHAP
jgi:phosphatidylglycerophosphate synthase